MNTLEAKPVCLIFGNDEYQVNTNARLLVDRFCPEADQALGLEIIEGQDAVKIDDAIAAIGRCVEAVQTVGFFGLQKVVWFRDMTFLEKKIVMKSDRTKEAMEVLVDEIKRGIQEGVRLVLSGPAVDKRSGLYRACGDAGHVLDYSVPDKAYQLEAHAREQAQVLFRKAGIQISPGDIDKFLGKVGVDTRQMVGEVEKLSLFLGDRKSAKWADIRDMVSPAKEATSWELQDAFGDRNLGEALRVTRLLLFQGGNPVGMVIGLESRCRELIMMKGCLKRGWCRLKGSGDFVQAEWSDNSDVEEFFEKATPNLRKLNPYRVGRLGAQSNNFGGEIMKIQEQIVRAHQDMIETSLPQRLTLELMLLKVLKKK